MKTTILFLTVLGFWAQAEGSFAQSPGTVVSGTVTDDAGPVPGANIMLTGTYDGTTSDEQGNFSFITTETGSHTLSVSYIGYKAFSTAVHLEGEPVNLVVNLREEINELNAVTISAGAFTASDEARRTVFRAIDVATTAGATADIAGALNTLPGTQKAGESGRLFVRGGDGHEVRTFIDGMLVLDAYSPSAPNTPSRGRFLPFMFKGISFSTGGYSAEYGGALSSALVLDSRDESTTTRTDFGILSVGGDVTHVQAWEGGSAAGKLSYSNLQPYFNLVRQEIDWDQAPRALEGIGAFRQRFGKHGIVKAYANFNRSDFSFYQHPIGDDTRTEHYLLVNDYQYFNAFARTALNEKWLIRGGLSYSDIVNKNHIDVDHHRRDETALHGKVVLDGSLSDHVELRTGVEVIDRSFGAQSVPDSGAAEYAGFDETISSVFAEADLYASNRFVTRAGVRGEYNSLNGTWSADPRISLALKTGDYAQVSFAMGTFRQSVRDEFLRIDPALLAERASHFMLNFQRSEDNRTFRAELYHKRYNDLLRFEPAGPDNTGYGYASGLDLFWRDNRSVKNLDYWLSYSFLDTERNYLHFPQEAVPSFASRHNFSVVGKYFVTALKSQLGATFSSTSGRVYNDPNSEMFNNGKTPAYVDLSIDWSFLPRPWLIVYASCTNVTGRDNIFGYEYAPVPDGSGVYHGRAIRQPAPRFLFLGIFITLSKDKSVNQLPTL